MAFNTYSNNQQDNKPTVNVYTPISFTNPESKVQKSRFSISYFNKMMQLSIALRNNEGSNEEFARYNNDNAVKVYISYITAKLLHDGIVDMLTNGKKNNVCVETKNGLLKVSNGIEYGSETPCISIAYAMSDGSNRIAEAIYQTNPDHTIAYNYSDGAYSTMSFPNFEIDTFVMALEQYYLASSYAIAATVNESGMYRQRALYDTIRAIAGKVGVPTGGNQSANGYSNHTFLNNSQNANSSTAGNNSVNSLNNVPKGYEQSSFDDIVNSMGAYSND